MEYEISKKENTYFTNNETINELREDTDDNKFTRKRIMCNYSSSKNENIRESLKSNRLDNLLLNNQNNLNNIEKDIEINLKSKKLT